MVTEIGELDLHSALHLLRHAGYSDALQTLSDGQAVPLKGLQTIIDLLCEISQHDALTGLANSRHFKIALEQEVDRVSRSGEFALLLLIDLDRFKDINDTYGHLAGDQALRAAAQVLVKNVRPMDTAARNGGDEFAAILPNCRPDAGLMIAERIREQVAQTPIAMPDGTKIQVTASIGGAHISPWHKHVPKNIIEKADQELYRAKALGRNRVSMDWTAPTRVTFDERHQLLNPFGRNADE